MQSTKSNVVPMQEILPESPQVSLLIVDDSEDDALLLLRYIKRNGIKANYQRVDNDSALKTALNDARWDLVITDHNMPGYSSSEAISSVKKYDPDLPVIIVSGEIGEDIAIKAMKDGAQDFVMKDNLGRLIPAIEREIRESENKHKKRQVEQDLAHLVTHDSLTGLPNRAQLEKALTTALVNAQQTGQQYILMFLDLDQFKIINDTCGHQAGDELIKQIAQLLQTEIRASDIIARLGGDEFGMLLRSNSKDQAMGLAKRIKDEVKAFRFHWGERNLSVSISIGMVPIDRDSQGLPEIMSAADIACYAAKETGRDAIKWFSPGDQQFDQMRTEMHWASKIKQAIEENSFFLCQQAMLDCGTNEIGQQREFLVRMVDGGETIPPGLFIPAAERYNMMTSIDRWVVEHVFQYLDETGLGQKDTGTYFINLSGNSLAEDDFFCHIRRLLKSYKVRPDRICFEITETAAIANLDDAVSFIKSIKEEGFKFALDDFGVGLSSFSYLKRFPVDYLKIDGSFVKNMLNDNIDQGIVKACNEIGHAAGLKTIAEFVEDQDTEKALKAIGIDYAQGFGIAKPVKIENFHS